MYPKLYFIAIVLAGTAGCYFAAIPRHDEIKRPVTSGDLVGEWVLSDESLRSMAVDGHAPKAEEERTITLRADGSCAYRTFLGDGTYLKKDGRWTVRYSETESFKNRLDFHFGDLVISRMKVAMNAKRMVLWESWGDPDAGMDLVYYKK